MNHHYHRHVAHKTRITLIDRLMNIAAVVHPLSAVPQVYDIYSSHDVSGISLITWFGFMSLGAVFLAYALVHEIRPLIVTQVLWFVVDFLVVTGVLLYRT